MEIHDAIVGISLGNESTADIGKTDFLDNRVGIYCPPSSLPGLQLKSVQLLISGCSFLEDGGYIAGGANPWAGIELHDM